MNEPFTPMPLFLRICSQQQTKTKRAPSTEVLCKVFSHNYYLNFQLFQSFTSLDGETKGVCILPLTTTLCFITSDVT